MRSDLRIKISLQKVIIEVFTGKSRFDGKSLVKPILSDLGIRVCDGEMPNESGRQFSFMTGPKPVDGAMKHIR